MSSIARLRYMGDSWVRAQRKALTRWEGRREAAKRGGGETAGRGCGRREPCDSSCLRPSARVQKRASPACSSPNPPWSIARDGYMLPHGQDGGHVGVCWNPPSRDAAAANPTVRARLGSPASSSPRYTRQNVHADPDTDTRSGVCRAIARKPHGNSCPPQSNRSLAVSPRDSMVL